MVHLLLQSFAKFAAMHIPRKLFFDELGNADISDLRVAHENLPPQASCGSRARAFVVSQCVIEPLLCPCKDKAIQAKEPITFRGARAQVLFPRTDLEQECRA
jgi:hypothetical protein